MKKQIKTLVKKATESLGYELTLNRVNTSASQCKPLVFVHIPKCGGVSVDRALREQLARPGEKKIKREPLIKTSLFNFNKDINTLEDKCDFSEFHCQQIQQILTYHLNLDWRYVSGHFNVTTEILNEFSDKYQFVTLLRDPVKRFTSNYIFNRLTNNMAIMPPSVSHKPMTKDELWQEADQIINSRRGWHMANTMTMFLAGRYPKDEFDAKNMQEEVLTNLKKFSVVGFLEDIPCFAQRLKTVTDKEINIGKHNITKELEPSDAEFIRHALTEYFTQPLVKEKISSLCKSELDTFLQAKSYFSK